MVQQNKIFTVQNLVQKIKEAKAIFLADYRGLSVLQMTQLRQTVKKAGGELEVEKNRLFKLALKESGKKTDIDLVGPTAILWSNEDEITPLKELVNFAKNNELPTIKFGFLGDDLLSADEVKNLSQIPGRSQLEEKMVGLLASPIYGISRTLNSNLHKLVYALKNLAAKQEN